MLETVLASIAGGATGGALASVAIRKLNERRARRRLLVFHQGVRCPGHIPGSQQSILDACPDAKTAA